MERVVDLEVRTGQVVTREGVIVWFRRGLSLFLFLVVIALVVTLPLPEHARDWQDPERQPLTETAVTEPSWVIDITVTAAPDYRGDS